jgi:hypothetical protein
MWKFARVPAEVRKLYRGAQASVGILHVKAGPVKEPVPPRDRLRHSAGLESLSFHYAIASFKWAASSR